MNQLKIKKESELKVEVKISTSDKKAARIIVKGKSLYRAIPALLFSPDESNTLLELVERVENNIKQGELIK